MLPGLEWISCKRKLDKLSLFCLEHWRLRGDLREIYKIVRGRCTVDSLKHFPWMESLKEMCGTSFVFTEGGECLEHTARGGGGGRYWQLRDF